MNFKIFLKSCFYDYKILMISIFIAMGIIAIMVEGKLYQSQNQQIQQFNAQIQKEKSQKMKQQIAKNQDNKPLIVSNGLKFEGVYRTNDVWYALINGRPLKALDHVDQFEVLEVTAHKVSLKNLETGETIFFTLNSVLPSASP